MDLRASYQYTYFIYPFLIMPNKYDDFIKKFLVDEEDWTVKLHDPMSDLNTYAYFLPYVRKFLFPTFDWDKKLKKDFKKMSSRRKLNIVKNLTCATFEYKMDKTWTENLKFGEEHKVLFEISQVKLICFEPGVCFLVFKTELDKKGDYIPFSDILDFNYKFRTVNPRYLKKKKTAGIHLKNQEFENVENLSYFIEKLLFGFEDVQQENIYFDRLFTYSYVCLDENEWNDDKPLDRIINEFYKFQYVLPGQYASAFDSNFKKIKDNTYTRWQYSIYGFSRESGIVFSSGVEKFNCTKLPHYFEDIYFYMMLLAFYQRIELLLFSQMLATKGNKNIEILKQRFTKFTLFSWFSQITNAEQGMDMWKKWQSSFDLPVLFEEVQKEYEGFYDYVVVRGQEKISLLLIILYSISVIFSGMALMYNLGLIDGNNHMAKIVVQVILALTIAVYPLYVLIGWIKKSSRD